MIPRTPPMLAASENSCPATCPSRPAAIGRRTGWSATMCGDQLVLGVEDRPDATRLGDQAVHLDPAPRLDTADVPAAQPDHGQAAATVVQLGDQGRHTGTR